MFKALLIMVFLLPVGLVLAVEATPSASAKPALDKKVEDLKERLASKVAELSQTQRKAVAGTVKSVSLTTLVVESSKEEYKIELTDDIKVIEYIKGKRSTVKTETLRPKDPVVIFGEFDTTLGILKAKVIVIQQPPARRVHGKVTGLDTKAATITLATSDGTSYTIDVERATKTNRWIGETNVEKSGFSKITQGDTIHVIGTNVPKKENRISADRILNLADLTGTPVTPTPAPTNTMKPSATPRPEP